MLELNSFCIDISSLKLFRIVSDSLSESQDSANSICYLLFFSWKITNILSLPNWEFWGSVYVSKGKVIQNLCPCGVLEEEYCKTSEALLMCQVCSCYLLLSNTYGELFQESKTNVLDGNWVFQEPLFEFCTRGLCFVGSLRPIGCDAAAK